MNGPEKWNRDDWRGATVLVLALGLALVLVIVALGVVFASDSEVGGRVGQTYAGILGAMIGSIATYVGGRHGRNGDDE